MIGRLVALLDAASAARQQPFVLVVTADHSTPVLYGDHAHEPVPLVLTAVGEKVGSNTDTHSLLSELLRADGAVQRFDEISCSRGVLGRFPGSELVPTISNFCSLVREHCR